MSSITSGGNWVPLPVNAWADALSRKPGDPFTDAMIIADLRWWVDRVCAPKSGVRWPGRRGLAARWCVSERKCRSMLKDEEPWLDDVRAETFHALIDRRDPTAIAPRSQVETADVGHSPSFERDGSHADPTPVHTRVVDQTSDYRLDPQGLDHLPEKNHWSAGEPTRAGGGRDPASTVSLTETATLSEASRSIDDEGANDPASIIDPKPEQDRDSGQAPPTPPLVMIPTLPPMDDAVDRVWAHWTGKVHAAGPKAGHRWRNTRRAITTAEATAIRRFVGRYGERLAIDLIDAHHDGAPGRGLRENSRGKVYLSVETLFKPRLLGDRINETIAWVEEGRPVDEGEALPAARAPGEPRPDPAWKIERAIREKAGRTWDRLVERIGPSGGTWRPPHLDEVAEEHQYAIAATWAGISAVGRHYGDGSAGGLGAILRSKRREEGELRRVFVEAYMAYDGDEVIQTEAVYVEGSTGFVFGGDR